MRSDRPISVIIPVLNEEEELPETLRRVWLVPEVGEVIVADGGSRDRTCEVAEEYDATIIESEPGRGTQLRTGSEAASGDVLLFLHADTWLTADAGRAALDLLNRPGVVAGGYWKRFR